MAITVICIVAVFFLSMGAYALAAPAAIVRSLGLVVDAPASRSEIRAVYGGFGIAIAGMLVLAAFDIGGLRCGVLVTVGAALAGMALGRIISRLIDRPTPFYPVWLYGLFETICAGALFAVAIPR